MLTQKKFMAIIEENFEERKAILDNPNKKRTAGSPDRMINFKRMAALRMVSEESAAVDLCTKQFTDILDMCSGKHGNSGDTAYLKELVYDVQNYLDIVLAIRMDKE